MVDTISVMTRISGNWACVKFGMEWMAIPSCLGQTPFASKKWRLSADIKAEIYIKTGEMSASSVMLPSTAARRLSAAPLCQHIQPGRIQRHHRCAATAERQCDLPAQLTRRSAAAIVAAVPMLLLSPKGWPLLLICDECGCNYFPQRTVMGEISCAWVLAFRPRHLVIQHQNTVHQPRFARRWCAWGRDRSSLLSSCLPVSIPGEEPLQAACKASTGSG